MITLTNVFYLSYTYITVNFYCVQIHPIDFISVSNRHLALKNESDQCANTYLQSQLCPTKVTSILR